jgi:hypothetical protein
LSANSDLPAASPSCTPSTIPSHLCSPLSHASSSPTSPARNSYSWSTAAAHDQWAAAPRAILTVFASAPSRMGRRVRGSLVRVVRAPDELHAEPRQIHGLREFLTRPVTGKRVNVTRLVGANVCVAFPRRKVPHTHTGPLARHHLCPCDRLPRRRASPGTNAGAHASFPPRVDQDTVLAYLPDNGARGNCAAAGHRFDSVHGYRDKVCVSCK